jgi:hypothetical protein
MALDGEIETLGPEYLNRPAEAEALARSAIAKHPHPAIVMRVARTLVPNAAGATEARVREVRSLIPATPDALHVFGMYLWSLANDKRAPVTPDVVRRLLGEALPALDAALKLKPDHLEALLYKSVVLRQQAGLESNAARAKALIAEADRLQAQAEKLRKR